ncbi:MAG: retention module-containing protein, partial [Candidatus Parcubacteria bacterium]|nr:retention module-containing protein [Burkholderiales bacterium]
MADLVGRVASVRGEAFAQSKESGQKRVLKVGDPVFDGDMIVAGSGVEVELIFDRAPNFLLRENETLTLDEFVFGARLSDIKENALLSSGREFEAVAEAIQRGESLDQLLEETSAGGRSLAGARDSHDFVQLFRILEPLVPLEYEFRSGGGGGLEPINYGGGTLEKVVLDFEALAVSTGSVATSITDTIQTTSLSLSGPSAVNETQAITYTATLS